MFLRSFKRAAVAIVPSTAAAPHMSMCISSIEPVGLRFKPPLSNVRPLPISATSSLPSLPPRYSSTSSRGSQRAPCPTAASIRRPSASRFDVPRMTDSDRRSLARAAMLCAWLSRKSGLATSARSLPRSRAYNVPCATVSVSCTTCSSSWRRAASDAGSRSSSSRSSFLMAPLASFGAVRYLLKL